MWIKSLRALGIAMEWNAFESLFYRIVAQKCFTGKLHVVADSSFISCNLITSFFFQAEMSDSYGIQKGFMSGLKQLDLPLKDESPRQQCHDGVTR